MSMLAEPRRKKAWVLNPKGSQWAEDDSKFGQKMLEQMGWSKGRGLGRTMDGITEHIRPSVQNDSRGLGYEGNADDWVAHLDDFNEVLAKLQGDQAESQTANTASTAPKSLEERSKKSRARVHYHKFTRGKDLSRASTQDLACILGGRADAAASQPATPVSSRPPSPPQQADSEPETEQTPQTRTEVDSNGYTTITTGKSCKDYFAEKMRRMNMLKIKHQQDGSRTSSNPDCTSPGDSSAREEISAGPEKCSLLRPSYLNRETVSLNVYAPSVPEENSPVSKKTKKKKRHTPESLDTPSSSIEINDVSEPKRKKKKNKADTVLDPQKPRKKTQKGKECSDDFELGNDRQTERYAVETSAEDKKRPSSKRKIAYTEEEPSAAPTTVTQNSEKKKKKKKLIKAVA